MTDPFEKGIDLNKIKEEFFERYKTNVQNHAYHPADIERLKRDNEWIKAFRKHGFGDLEKTISLMNDAFKWRKDFGANDFITQDGRYPFPEEMLNRGAMFVRGTDINSRPLLHLVIRMHRKGQFTFTEYCKFIAFHLEREYCYGITRPIVLLLDMHEAGYSNLDMEMAKFVMTCLKNYYPGLIEYILVFQMPFLFNAAWKIIKNLLPAAAVKLVKFVDKQSIREFVNEDQLLIHMGGTDKFKFEYEPSNFLKDTLSKQNFLQAKTETIKRDSVISQDEEINLRMRKIINTRSHIENSVVKSVVKSTIEYSARSLPIPSKSEPFAITPHDLIVFHFKENKPASQYLNLRNNQGVPIAYKIKITSPNKFRVKPPVGIVKAQSESSIRINLSKEFYKNFTADSTNEKLLVLWMPIEDTVITDDLYEFWKQALGKKLDIKEHRIKCVVRRGAANAVPSSNGPVAKSRPLENGHVEQKITETNASIQETPSPTVPNLYRSNLASETSGYVTDSTARSTRESMEISSQLFKESQQKMDKQSQIQLFLIFFLILLNIYQLIYK